ncbi:lysosomal proton-coupled steroid conjugate and bile acid symporter SLC46A3 isoform X1 [Misgurnus anguillicaudatus]|uniref:lysosomal proton-coupled steroid conjugate and bile acid symporter SLC46A3 isoform X1 n=1 Tax=Misgurnus anguillicaudatus TaxID=75329 RepID=UPI003CCEFEF1
MGRVYLIEPVVGLYAFTMFMTYPLLQQYVYRRLWLQLSGTPYPAESLSHCSNNHTNVSIHEAVQKETSIFLLQCELFFLIPSLVSALLLVSYSDYRGRKVAIIPPLVGDALFTLSYVIVSRYSFNLKYLLASSFLTGMMGGPTSLIGGCFAYVADLCGEDPEGRKTVRMARLDMILGVLSGLASLCTGFYINAAGFTWPFLTAFLMHLLNLCYVMGVLKESLVLSTSNPTNDVPRVHGSQALAARLQGVYLLFAASTRRRNVLLLLLLTAFAFYKFSIQGGMSIFILYELNTPLCWSEVLVGYGSALSTAIFLVSFAGVALLSRCLRDGYIILLGLMSVAAGLIMTAFAKTTLLMFLVRLPLLLSIMPIPVLRSKMSKLVAGSEQGAMFACVAFVEILSAGVSFAMFSSIYAATLSWFSGFTFLLAASFSLIPATLICVVLCLRLDEYEESNILIEDNNTEIFELPP